MYILFILTSFAYGAYSQCSNIFLGGGSYISEISTTITTCDGSIIYQSPDNLSNSLTECIDLPESYIIYMNDSYGDGWTGNILSIDNVIYSMSCMWPNCSVEIVQVNTCPGCMDELACNYSQFSQVDDGSCTYSFDCAGICGGPNIEDECGNCYDPNAVEELEQQTFNYTGRLKLILFQKE